MIITLLEWGLNLVYLGILVTILGLIIGAVIARRVSSPTPVITRRESEKYFLDRINGKKKLFPIANYFKEDEIEKVSLSVVVPAYNEEKRLPTMLDECLAYLEKRVKKDSSFTYEVIVVDDGSTDRTTQVALEYSDRFTTEKVRVLKLERNRGKGGAVRFGVLSSRGKWILFADADGATTFSELDKLEGALSSSGNNRNNIPSIAIGSRAHLEEASIATRSTFRTVLMYGFHFVVWLFTVRSVRDTQCGFKLFPRQIALILFSSTHIERWAFDVELLSLCERMGVHIHEVCVEWREIEGSKIVPVFSWLQMGRDVLFVSFMYAVRAWKVPSLPPSVIEKQTSSNVQQPVYNLRSRH